ncbi:hypothetical protein BJV82DRAFT_241781 [Fennellomyces sp. T-0311]|nr:hypothetical protein BJV82DRAFT_241781 [Fennellomyces sp. T-0311]
MEVEAVIHTLPDKGAKLKQSIRQIDVLLLSPELLDDEITVENTFADRESALTSKLAGLSFLTPRQEARKRGIAMANARAQHQPYIFKRRNSSSVLMRRPSSYLVEEAELPSKVCMMSLEESVKLQEHHQRLLEESNRMLPPPPMPVSLDDSLSMTMSRMQLTGSQPPPLMLNKIDDDEDDDYMVPQGVYFDGMKKTGSEDQIMMSSDEEDDYSRDYDDHDEDDDHGL